MTIERIPISNREQWLALRTKDITASDVPAVCGEGVYGSAAKVWAEKRGLVSPDEMNEAMKRGIWGEPAVAEALAWERPTWELRRAKVYLRDPDARLGATPDAVAIDPERPGIGICQFKVVSRHAYVDKWLANPDDDPHDAYSEATPPLGYQIQTLTEMMLAESQWGCIVALVVDTWRWSLHVFPMERHAVAEQTIRDKVATFWRDHLIPGVQPQIDPARDESLVKALHPQDDGREIDLTGDNEMPGLVDELTSARAEASSAEKRAKVAKTSIADKMGPASFARIADGRRVSHKLQRRAGYEVKPTEYRVLKVLNA
jgi:hypothetical protein